MSNIYEINRDLFFEYVSGDVDGASIINEGANLDQTAVFSRFSDEYKPTLKSLKSNVKNGNKSDAKKDAEKCRKLLADVKKEIARIDADSNLSSAVLGNIATTVGSCIKATCVALITSQLVPGQYGGGLVRKEDMKRGARRGAAVSLSIDTYRDLKNISNSIKETHKSGGSISVRDFNTYRNNIIKSINKLEKALAKYEVRINKM